MSKRRFLDVPMCDWCWVVALALIRVLIGLRYGLGVDEAHYALYGIHLDWSYFDHPPLVGWVQAFFLSVLGHHDWAVHLPAEIAAVVMSIQAFRLGQKLTGDEKAARWGAIALNVSFLPNGLWFMFVPDTILLILVFWLVEIVMRLHARGYQELRDWCEFGICVGLCGLAKYTAVLLLPGLGAFFLWEQIYASRNRDGKTIDMHEFYRSLFIAVVLAALVVSPVFYWNFIHDWLSFDYQIRHVVHAHVLSFGQRLHNLAAFCGVQVVAYSPFVILASIMGWRSFFSVEASSARTLGRLILWLALPCLLFFAYSGAREAGLPHWTFYAWGLLLPAGVAAGISLQRKRISRVMKTLVVVSGVLVAVLFFELAFHVIHYPADRSPYNDFAGWRELRPSIKKAIDDWRASHVGGKDTAIGVPNWTLGSRANWYFSDLAPVYVLDDRFDQFDLWEGAPPIGKDILILEWRGFPMSPDQKSRCTSIQPVGSKIFSEHGIPITSVQLWWCRSYGAGNRGA